MNNSNLALKIENDQQELILRIDRLLAQFEVIHNRVEELFSNRAFVFDVGNEIALALAPKDDAETDKKDQNQKDGSKEYTDNK
uniref:Uncharacterized protein n=1 Tax=Panagrolaimus sp. PS1159 TaxID=55785 RepID=A0AC35GN43_9BILA